MVRSHFSDLYVVCCWFYRGGVVSSRAAGEAAAEEPKGRRNGILLHETKEANHKIENARHRYHFIIYPYYSSPNLKHQLLYLQHISRCCHNSNSIGKQRLNSWRCSAWWPEWWLGLDSSEWRNCNIQNATSDHLNNFP